MSSTILFSSRFTRRLSLLTISHTPNQVSPVLKPKQSPFFSLTKHHTKLQTVHRQQVQRQAMSGTPLSVHSSASTPESRMLTINDTDTDNSSQPLYIDSGDEETHNVIDLDASDASDYDSNDDDGLDLSAPPPDQHSKLREVKCPICLEPPDRLCVTECGHLYCGDCVFKALSSGVRASDSVGECSICRKSVVYKNVVFLETRMGPLLKDDDDEYETDDSIEDDRNVKVQKMHESLTYDLDEVDTLDLTPSLPDA
jgi:hypothetical protein